MKKIEDYLPLYLGCDALISDGKTNIIAPITPSTLINILERDWKVTPRLRPLSSMTEREFTEMLTIANENNIKILERDEIVLRQTAPEIMRFLISRSFDIFGLIESGLANDFKS